MLTMLSLAERTRQAMDAGFTNDQLARAAGVSSGAVSQWLNKTKSLKASCIPGLVALTGWSAEWWATGKGQRQPVAHSMSLTPFNIPTQIAWGDLMVIAVLPQSFTVAMPDDSMKGSIERGTVLVFETNSDPVPGHGVLVEDKDGNRYIRQYRKGRGDSWNAYAKNEAAFDSLESERDGLKVLACMRGVMSGAL